MSAPSKQFNPQEFAATIARVQSGTDYSQTPIQPRFDPRQAREIKLEKVAGRKIEDYKPALEAHGFNYVPAEHLEPYADGRTHTEGEWRCSIHKSAWTEAEVLSFFPTPQKLAEYMERLALKKRAKRAGIVLKQR